MITYSKHNGWSFWFNGKHSGFYARMDQAVAAYPRSDIARKAWGI